MSTMIKDDMFTVISDDGSETVFSVLATYDLEETNKSYVIYTKDEVDDKGALKVYASTYIQNGRRIEFGQIKTKEEWDAVNEALVKIKEYSDKES